MNIEFNIDFNTKWGEELYVTGSSQALGAHDLSKALKLDYSEGGKWSGKITINAVKERRLQYRYFVKNNLSGNPLEEIYFESGKPRNIVISTSTLNIERHDRWCGNSGIAPFLSAPFSDVFFAEGSAQYSFTHKVNNELIISAMLPNLPIQYKVLLCGNTKELGEWNPKKGVEMTRVEGLRWETSLQVEKAGSLEFKFVVCCPDGSIIWEEGENRSLETKKIGKHSTIVAEEGTIKIKLETPRYAGCAVPLFALRSKESHGIGDTADFKLFIEWIASTGQKVIQLLPINDTTQNGEWGDSYPYNCISTIAINPIYINLKALGELKDKKLEKELHREAVVLNHNYFVDYPEVYRSKMRYCRAIYSQERENTVAEPLYYTYIKENREWLFPYALFCALRDKFKSTDFTTWKEYATYDRDFIEKLFAAKTRQKAEESSLQESLREDALFYIYLQYHLHKQFTEVKEYAHKCGVILKGDIPIGISSNGVEAWQYPQYYNFGQQAGAPPDYFSEKGQNWGFPTYNWDEMAKDGYNWWKVRLNHLAEYFDAYRIDHILGFFRIWEIPTGISDGRYGHFHPAMPLSRDEIYNAGLEEPFKRFTITVSQDNAIDAEREVSALFIEDPYQKGKYHPMISAMDGAAFALLTEREKKLFRRLYEDYFYSRHNEFWYKNAVKKLQQLIAATNMLACGEDLGMLSESVHRCMENLHILSLELMIMPKQPGVEISDPRLYPYLSVCATSTHDSETLRMWLGERLGTKGNALKESSTPENPEYEDDAPVQECIKVLEQNLGSDSMLAIFPLQDWLAIDENTRNRYVSSERINNPADPHNKWRYRIHLGIEQLIAAKQLNRKILHLIEKSGR